VATVNGELAEAVSLVSYGNFFFRAHAKRDAVLSSGHSAFRYVKTTRFIYREYAWRIIPVDKEVATSPDAWFLWLKTHNVTTLQLAITIERRWVIRALSERGICIWRPTLHYAGDRRNGAVWNLTCKGSLERGARYRKELGVDIATDNLRYALDAATTFAGAEGMHEWQQRFVEAKSTLDLGPVAIPYHPDLLVRSADDAHRLAAASAKAWVFKGMGSWDDLKIPRAEYRKVTAALYDAVLDALAAAVNADT
jgi:hypothetical protein